jgi:ubiquitin-protein ligase
MENNSPGWEEIDEAKNIASDLTMQCNYGRQGEIVKEDVAEFMNLHYVNFECTTTYDNKTNEEMIVLYGKLQCADTDYKISIVIPQGYPFKTPKVYIMDELSDFNPDVISKKHQRVMNICDGYSQDDISHWSIQTYYEEVREILNSYPCVKGKTSRYSSSSKSSRSSKSSKKSKSKRKSKSKSRKSKSKKSRKSKSKVSKYDKSNFIYSYF